MKQPGAIVQKIGWAGVRFVHQHQTKDSRGYAPSFFEAGFLNETHEGLVERLADVRGKLEDADHFKLYEAAYFAQGPILEIGRLAGKSTVCLALGSRDGSGQPIYSIEYANKYLQMAQENLDTFGVLDRVTLVQGDSATQVPRLPRPDTVFVDGDHSYEGVRRDIEALNGHGAVLMFHDYFHYANDHGDYGVARAVTEASGAWGFRGRFGGIALFESRTYSIENLGRRGHGRR